MAGKTFIWTVPRDVFDLLNHKAAQLANGFISEEELIDTMRMYGFPPEATLGDHIHIQFQKPIISIPNQPRVVH